MKVEKALARRVALLGVKVTGIKPPRLSFVAVDGRPISRGFDSCRTHFLREIKKRKEKRKRERERKNEESSPQGENRAMWGEDAKPLKRKNDAERKSDL